MFLLFLPDFTMNTHMHFLLINGYYKTFNSIIEKFEKIFDSFHDDFIEKITKMLIYILEYVKVFPITSLKRNYCNLTFNTILLSSDHDSDHFDDDSEKLNKKENKFINHKK